MTSPLRPEIIAHRGYSARAPENTLPALEAAVQARAHAVEFDVQTAACGTPVLFHDAMLGRTTNGVGPVRRRPLAHLKELDAGRWFGAAFAGTAIPSLEEALALLAGRIGHIYQDIKGYREMEDLDRMVEVTRKSGLAGSTVFLSADWVVMNRLRQVARDIRRAYLVEDAQLLPEALDRAIVDEGAMLSVEVGMALANPQRIREAVEAGVELVAWTVDEPFRAVQAREHGIHRITTNQVDRLMAWRNALD